MTAAASVSTARAAAVIAAPRAASAEVIAVVLSAPTARVKIRVAAAMPSAVPRPRVMFRIPAAAPDRVGGAEAMMAALFAGVNSAIPTPIVRHEVAHLE